jgi:hypothetical protein
VEPGTTIPSPFDPSPPMSDQLQRLIRQVSRLRALLSFSPSLSTDRLLGRVNTITSRFGNGLLRVLRDLWRQLRTTVPTQNADLIQGVLSGMQQAHPILGSLVDDLRKIQHTFFDRLVTDFAPGFQGTYVPALKALSTFVEDISNKFVEQLLDSCEKLIDRGDVEGYFAVRPTVVHRLTAHHKDVRELHLRIVNRVYVFAKHCESQPDLVNALLDDVAIPLVATLRGSRWSIVSQIERFWARDRHPDHRAESFAIMIVSQLLFDDLVLIDKEAEFFNRVRDEEGNPAVAFLREEIRQMYVVHMRCIRALWARAERDGKMRDVSVIGQAVINILNSEIDAGLLIPVSEIAELFLVGARYHDDRTLSELVQPILVRALENLIRKLMEHCNREIRIVCELPKRVVEENANEEAAADLPPEEVEQRKAEVQSELEEVWAELGRETPQFHRAMRTCHCAVFAYRLKDSSKGKAIQLPSFTAIESGFMEKMKRFVDRMAKIRSGIIDLVREEERLSAGQPVEPFLAEEEKLQIQYCDRAIRRGQDELFQSLKRLFRVAIRSIDEEKAKQLRARVKKQHAVTRSQYEELHRESLKTLDVVSVKTADEHLDQSLFKEQNFITKCLANALRDVVERTIWNAHLNMKSIQEEYDREVKSVEQTTAQRLSALETQTVEPRVPLATTNRGAAIVAQAQRRIEGLLANRQYDEAAIEKKRLDEIKAKHEGDRKTTLEKQAQKRGPDDQSREGELLRSSCDRKLAQLAQTKNRRIEEQEKLLGSSVKYQTQQLVNFAGRLTPEVVTAKKTAAQRLGQVAREVMKAHDLEHLMSS